MRDYFLTLYLTLFQIELVLKFLQKAALSLREPYYLKAPSAKLSGKDRVIHFWGHPYITSQWLEGGF